MAMEEKLEQEDVRDASEDAVTSPPPSSPSLRKHPPKRWPSALVAFLFSLFLMLQFNGFMVYLILPPILIWALFVLDRARKNREYRKIYLAQLGVWALAIALAMGVHYILSVRARHYADEIVAKVESWQQTHGHYPDQIELVGVTRKEMRSRNTGYAYSENEPLPRLFYIDTFMVFASWHYDFSQKVWVYSPG